MTESNNTYIKPNLYSEASAKEGYKKTKLGWIPEDWNISSVGNYLDFIGGNAFKSDDSTEEGVRWLKIANVGIQKIIWEDESHLPSDFSNRFEKYLLSEGDVVMALTRPILNNRLKIARLDRIDSGALLNQRVGKLLPKENSSLRYFYYLFQTNYVVHRMEVAMAGTDPPNIGFSDLRKIKISVPPLPEQKKIAAILFTWDRAIETLEQLLAKKEDLKKGLMHQLLNGEKRFPGFEGEWREVRFKDVVKIDAKSLNSKTLPDYEFEYISLSDVENGQISKELEVHEFKDAPSRAKRIVSEGDILMATVRPNLQAFALAKKEHHGKIASTGFAVLTPKKDFNIKYLYHCLFSHHVSGQFYALTVGSNYPAINSSDVKKLKIRLPADYEEINKIESVLTNIDKEIKSLEKKKEMLTIQKQGLMQQLLTGKTRVYESY